MMNARLFTIVALIGSVLAAASTYGQGVGGSALQSRSQSIVNDRSSNLVASGVAESIATRMIRLTLSVEQTKGHFERFAYQPNKILLQKFDNNTLLVWDFERSTQIAEFRLEPGTIPVHYDTLNWRLLTLRNGNVYSTSLDKKGEQKAEKLVNDPVTSIAVSGDQKTIYTGHRDGTVTRLTDNGKAVWKKQLFNAAVVQLHCNQDGKRFSALAENKQASLLDGVGTVVVPLKDVKRLGEFNVAGAHPVLLQSGQIATVTSEGKLSLHAAPQNLRSFSLNRNGSKLLTVSENGELNIGFGGQWQPIDNQIKDAAFVGEKRFLTAKDNGVIHLKEINLPHYLVAIIPAQSGWVIVDHEGRYDGTVDGGKDVKWTSEGSKLSLDQFFQTYYQPGLLAAYVSEGEATALQAVPANTGVGVFPPAQLELQFPDGKMKAGQATKVLAIAESTGGELPEDIRLFHNGKRLPEKTRIGSQRVQQGGKILLVQVFSFMPEPGVNEVFGEIRNAHGVGSRSEITKEITDGYRSQGRLLVFGTGIDKYRSSEINLDFAAVDVKAIVKYLDLGSKGIHKETLPKVIIDAKATKREIIAQLAELEKSNPEDSVILIFAGHGQMEDGEWYFLPHDVDLKQIKKTSISAREIQDALVAAPARRIFMMFDSCNSGAGIDSFNRFRAFQRRFAQEVGRNAGVTVLTATRRDQQAAELSELGHGMFTHVILEGLYGQASAGDGNGKISAHQLANYVGANLERFAQPYLAGLGVSQSPAHFVIGSDFLISNRISRQ
jgi:hypothetical protein